MTLSLKPLFYKEPGPYCERFATQQPADPDVVYEVWNNAHTATLEDYQLKEGPSVLFIQEDY